MGAAHDVRVFQPQAYRVHDEHSGRIAVWILHPSGSKRGAVLMGATMKWALVSKGNSLGVGSPSSFMERLERAFPGNFPMDFCQGDLERLRGMAAVDEDFDKLIQLIEHHGAIRVWPEY